MKTCIDCNNIYPFSYFYKNIKMPDGHLNSCKSCRQKYNKKYKEDNKVELSLKTKEWKDNNSERVKEYRKMYYSMNREREIELSKEWIRLNRDSVKLSKLANNAKRRFNKRQATPWWSDLDKIKSIYSRARELSVLTGIPHHVDHIIPLIHPLVQGLNVPANLQVVPYFYNLSKGNKLIEDIVCTI